MTIELIVSVSAILSTITGVIFWYIGRQSQIKQQYEKDGEDYGGLKRDIAHVMFQIEQVLSKMERMNDTLLCLQENYGNLNARMILNEKAVSVCHERLDTISLIVGGTKHETRR